MLVRHTFFVQVAVPRLAAHHTELGRSNAEPVKESFEPQGRQYDVWIQLLTVWSNDVVQELLLREASDETNSGVVERRRVSQGTESTQDSLKESSRLLVFWE